MKVYADGCCNKSKPKYPYLARVTTSRELYVVDKSGAIKVEGYRQFYAFGSGTSITEDDFDPLPIGVKVTLENT